MIIESSNIKSIDPLILEEADILTSKYFGKDFSFIKDLNKHKGHIFYIRNKDEKLAGFASVYITQKNNQDINEIISLSSNSKDLKNKLFPCGENSIGNLHIIVLEKELRGTNASIELTKKCEDFIKNKNINNAVCFAWKHNGKAPAKKSLDYLKYEFIEEIDNPLIKKCISGELLCPFKEERDNNGCDCKYLIFFKGGLLQR